MPRKGSDQSDSGDAGDETEVRGDDLRTTFISRSALPVVKTYVGVFCFICVLDRPDPVKGRILFSYI